MKQKPIKELDIEKEAVRHGGLLLLGATKEQIAIVLLESKLNEVIKELNKLKK